MASQRAAEIQKEMEDYLARIENVNKVVKMMSGDIEEEPKPVKEKKPAPKPPSRYSADYAKWDKFDPDAEPKEEKKEKEDDEELDFAEKVCKDEANRSKEKGNRQFKEGDYKAAHWSYSHCMSLDPDNITAPLNRAMVNIKLENWDEGLEDCERVLKVEKYNPKALMRRATIYQKTDRFEEALKEWQYVLKLNPRSKEAKDAIPQCRLEIREREKLQKALDQESAGGKSHFKSLKDVVEKLIPSVDKLKAMKQEGQEVPLSLSQVEGDEEAAQTIGRVLASLAGLTSMLNDEPSHIYFRTLGGLTSVSGLVRFMQCNANPDDEMTSLITEGALNVLAYALITPYNLSTWVTAEKVALGDKHARDGILGYSVQLINTAKKALAQSALHFLSAATEDEWVRAMLLIMVDSKAISEFPTHDKSGLSLAFITQIIDNCMKSIGWQEEFKKMNLIGFLMSFGKAEYPMLKKSVAGAIMRLTTTEFYRHELLKQSDGAYIHLPALIQTAKAELIPAGTKRVQLKSCFVVEGLFSAMVNCMTTEPTEREAIANLLFNEGVTADALALVQSYVGVDTFASQGINDDAIAAVCRALGIIAKSVAYENIMAHVVADGDFIKILPTIVGHYASSIFDASFAEQQEMYGESLVESASIILGLASSKMMTTAEDEVVDVCGMIYGDWVLLCGLLTHPNNNICGNAALIMGNMAARDNWGEAMGRHKMDVVKLLLDAIKSKRDELFSTNADKFIHPKNTAANNNSCQMNCAIALAKLARDEANRDKLRDLKGMEILHTVLQGKK